MGWQRPSAGEMAAILMVLALVWIALLCGGVD